MVHGYLTSKADHGLVFENDGLSVTDNDQITEPIYWIGPGDHGPICVFWDTVKGREFLIFPYPKISLIKLVKN